MKWRVTYIKMIKKPVERVLANLEDDDLVFFGGIKAYPIHSIDEGRRFYIRDGQDVYLAQKDLDFNSRTLDRDNYPFILYPCSLSLDSFDESEWVKFGNVKNKSGLELG